MDFIKKYFVLLVILVGGFFIWKKKPELFKKYAVIGGVAVIAVIAYNRFAPARVKSALDGTGSISAANPST